VRRTMKAVLLAGLCLIGLAVSAQAYSPVTVVRWGSPYWGLTDVPAGLTNVNAIAAGHYHNLAIRGDGTVAAWGMNSAGQTDVPAGLSNVVAVTGGEQFSFALTADHTLVGWGINAHGQLNVPAGLNDAVAIAAGGYHMVALRSDGTVVCWGNNDIGQSNVPAGLSNVVAIGAGHGHSMAVKADGTVVCWGWNGYGQCSPPAGLNNAVAVAGGDLHTIALCADGSVVGWGDNSQGQLNVPAGLTATQIGTSKRHNVALRTDGTVATWGSNDYGANDVPAGLSNVVAIAAGGYHSVALRLDAVTDTTPPDISGAITFVAGATSPSGAVVDFIGLQAIDNVDGPVPVICNPPSGSLFPIGNTLVGYYATDSAGNINGGTFLVTVVAPPPTFLSGPSDMQVTATSAGGAVVNYTPPVAYSWADGYLPVTCTPPPGSTFPLGTTVVGCTATDQYLNTVGWNFLVTVTYSWSGFQSPAAGSTYKVGKNVPVAFQLTGASAPIRNANAVFLVDGVSQGTFSYNRGASQYQFTWKTRGFSRGAHVIEVDLGDGVSRTMTVTLN
jgi:hypothetical protein